MNTTAISCWHLRSWRGNEMPDWVTTLISPLCALAGVALGSFLTSCFSARNLKEQERRANLQKIYTEATIDVEKVRVDYYLVFDNAYIKQLDTHFALIKLFASKEVEDRFKKFASYIHSFQKAFSKFYYENFPTTSNGWEEDDPEYPYLVEEFKAKIKDYKRTHCPTLKELDKCIEPLQIAMRKDLDSDKDKK